MTLTLAALSLLAGLAIVLSARRLGRPTRLNLRHLPREEHDERRLPGGRTPIARPEYLRIVRAR
jgi:hypothetical protein